MLSNQELLKLSTTLSDTIKVLNQIKSGKSDDGSIDYALDHLRPLTAIISRELKATKSDQKIVVTKSQIQRLIAKRTK